MSIIKVEHLEKAYGKDTPIKDINFEVNKGDVIAIIGHSGTGKSTLIRIINMLDKPTSGKIYFHDECVNDENYNVNKLREHIGMVFQSFNLFNHKTVMENIIMAPMDLLGLSKDEAINKATKLLKEVGLYSKRDNYPDELSGGQKQRIAIARCLAMDPEVILFDEPTSALDPTMVNEVKSIIKKLAVSGKTMMIVTHELDFAKSVSNRVFYLDQGIIYEEGSPNEIFDNPKKERTINFINRIKEFKYDTDMNDFDLSELLDSFLEYARRNEFSKKMTYRLALLVEEIIMGMVKNNVENLSKISIIIDHKAKEKRAAISIYFNGCKKEIMSYDKISEKILESYCKDMRFVENDNGYDMHISFNVIDD